MFDETDVNELFKHKSHDHAIETKNKILSFDSIYNLSITKFEVFRKYLNDNLKKVYGTLFIVCRRIYHVRQRKDEHLRLCVNYKSLNFITAKIYTLYR